MPTTKKKGKTASSSNVGKQAKAKKTAKKTTATAPVNWSTAIAKAAEQKRTQAHWPGTGESWKKKVRT